jgi:hypothetical protein
MPFEDFDAILTPGHTVTLFGTVQRGVAWRILPTDWECRMGFPQCKTSLYHQETPWPILFVVEIF